MHLKSANEPFGYIKAWFDLPPEAVRQSNED